MVKPLLLVALVILLPAPLHAQISAPAMLQPALNLGPAISYRDHVNAQESARKRRLTETPATSGAGGATPTAVSASTRYQPDQARRRANLAEFVAKTRAKDPASADGLAQIFAEGDFIERIKPLVGTVGLDVTNVADAYAFYWVVAWNASRGENPTPNRRTMDAVRGQATDLLLTAPAFLSADQAARQKMAEALWVQAVVLDQAVDHSRGKPELMKGIAGAARQGAQAISLDLSTMTLADDGFRPVEH